MSAVKKMQWTTKNIALCAVLTALALGLSTLENLFPVSLVIPLPGVKLGLPILSPCSPSMSWGRPRRW